MVYKDLYQFILEHRLIKHVITIQRFFRKKKMQRWLRDHQPQCQIGASHPKSVKVDVSFLEPNGKKERNNVECGIF